MSSSSENSSSSFNSSSVPGPDCHSVVVCTCRCTCDQLRCINIWGVLYTNSLVYGQASNSRTSSGVSSLSIQCTSTLSVLRFNPTSAAKDWAYVGLAASSVLDWYLARISYSSLCTEGVGGFRYLPWEQKKWYLSTFTWVHGTFGAYSLHMEASYMEVRCQISILAHS